MQTSLCTSNRSITSKKTKLSDLFIKKIIPAIIPAASTGIKFGSAAKAAKVVAAHKVGGHEQSNHDEESLKMHLEQHDKEHAPGSDATMAAAADIELADGRTPLHIAAAIGDLDRIEKIIKES